MLSTTSWNSQASLVVVDEETDFLTPVDGPSQPPKGFVVVLQLQVAYKGHAWAARHPGASLLNERPRGARVSAPKHLSDGEGVMKSAMCCAFAILPLQPWASTNSRTLPEDCSRLSTGVLPTAVAPSETSVETTAPRQATTGRGDLVLDRLVYRLQEVARHLQATLQHLSAHPSSR